MKHKQKEERKESNKIELGFMTLGFILVVLMAVAPFAIAVPTGPSSISFGTNETSTPTAGVEVNISGGYIANFNITANTQNPHWKGFVGHIDGKFSLDDASGDTLYDWSLTSVGGEVYASRNSSTTDWANIGCATAGEIVTEDTTLWHTGEDNITSTFNETNTGTFIVAGTSITATSCAATYTYVNSGQQTTDFEEVVLHDNINVIFATILEDDVTGFDGRVYDFQMIVPENGSSTWTGQISYYLYVELS